VVVEAMKAHAWLLGVALAGCATAPPAAPPVEPPVTMGETPKPPAQPAPRPGPSPVSPVLEAEAQLSAARAEAIRQLRRYIEKYPDHASTPDAVRRLLAVVSEGGDPAELAATVEWLRTLPLRDQPICRDGRCEVPSR
jgi:hypothetical protein